MWSYARQNPLSLAFAWTAGGAVPETWPQFAGRTVVPTHLSRVAIVLAFEALGLRAGDEILVPAYQCGSEVDPFIACGATPVMYRVDDRARIDIDDVRARIGPRTRGLYVTHYFGWPHPLRELRSLCDAHGMVLVEDCALSLFGAGPEGAIGTVGDAAIHCFWKMLPVPDGGALVLSPGRSPTRPLVAPAARAVLQRIRPFVRAWARSGLRSAAGSAWTLAKRLRRRIAGPEAEIAEDAAPPEMPADYYFDDAVRDRGMSRVTAGLLARCRPDEIIRARRKNYLALLEAVRGLQGVEALFDGLPEGVCPLLLPLRATDPIATKRALAAAGAYPIRWWKGFHRALSWEEFPEARSLKGRVLAFQVDQTMRPAEVDDLAERIRSVAR